jgi:hypothetical protein
MDAMMTGPQIRDSYNELYNAWLESRAWRRDMAKYMHPRRYHELNTSVTPNQEPDKGIYADVVDAIGSEVLIVAATELASWTTPKTDQWLVHSAPAWIEKTEEVRRWLEKSTKVANEYRLHSNFYDKVYELFFDLMLGCACLGRFFDPQTRKFHYRAEGDFVFALGRDEEIDTYGIKRVYQARVAAMEFGYENLPKSVQALCNDPIKCRQTAEYVHWVMPNPDYREGSKLWMEFPWISQWIHLAEGQTIGEGGAHDCPYIAARFLPSPVSNPSCPSGWSPMFAALPDLRELNNKIVPSIHGAIEREVDPATFFPPTWEGPIVRIRARSAYLMGEAGEAGMPRYLQPSAKVDWAMELANQLRENVRRKAMLDIFQAFRGIDLKNVTAEAIRAKLGERADMLPMFGLILTEFLTNQGQWEFNQLAQHRLLPDVDNIPSPLMEGGAVRTPRISFSNKLSLLLEAATGTAGMEAAADLASMAQQTGDPRWTDIINPHKLSRSYWRAKGADTENTNTDTEVSEIEESRAVQMANMMQAQQEAMAAQTAV